MRPLHNYVMPKMADFHPPCHAGSRFPIPTHPSMT